MPKTAAFMIFILVAAERQICQKMRQIYDFQFQWQQGGRRSVRRVGRRLTPLALPVPYTPHLGIDSIKTGPKNGLNLSGVQKWTQSKRGPKRASIKMGPKFSQNIKGPKNLFYFVDTFAKHCIMKKQSDNLEAALNKLVPLVVDNRNSRYFSCIL